MDRTEIVETVAATTMAELRTRRDQAIGDLVELRLDWVGDLDVGGALSGRHRPVIATCRASWEGGRFEGSEEERLRILEQAARLGAEFVDVEWRADRRRFAVPAGTAVVLSHHDFAGIPADLEDRLTAMRAEDTAVVKIAVTPGRLSDVLRLRQPAAPGPRYVAIAMGSQGLVTRLCPWAFGSCWTYGGAAAPGQVPVRDLVQSYRVRSGSPATSIYGVAGAPLGHSASPAMHNAAFAALGLDATYVTFETADPDDCLRTAGALGVSGLSVTAPLKPALFARAHETDALSKTVGALNTLRRHAARWSGRNYDAAGLLAPLESRGMALDDVRAVVLGAGGAARTAVWALQSNGARVEIAARRRDQAEALARELRADAGSFPPAPGWDLLVNTTPVGTWPAVAESPLDRDQVHGRAVYDLIYNPPETTLLRWAREAGAEVIGGLEMLVSQACLQFEWWTGRQAPRPLMAEAAAAFIRDRNGSQS
jgi:3-dehydroquinate dehydratase/shikimate dehydrogenase